MQVFFTVWSVSSAIWSHNTNLLWPSRSWNPVKLSGQSLSGDRCDMRMATRIAPSAALEANYYMSFIVLRIVATVASLINSLGNAVRKLSNKRSSIPLWKKCDIVVSGSSENGTKVTKLAKDFNITTMMLTTVLKIKDEIISDLLLSEHMRKHDTLAEIQISEHLWLGQAKVNKIKNFLPFSKFLKRTQTKFYAHIMRESQIIK